MTLYQRYIVAFLASPLDEPTHNVLEQKPLYSHRLGSSVPFESSYFRASPIADQIHPLGQGRWSGDLTSTIVIILAASSKTAAAFAYELRNKGPPGTCPLGIMSVASRIPTSEAKLLDGKSTPLPIRADTYSSMLEPSALEWCASSKGSRNLIMDFGAHDNAAERLTCTLNDHEQLRTVNTAVVGAGAVHKPGLSAQRVPFGCK